MALRSDRPGSGYVCEIQGAGFKELRENDKVEYDLGQGTKGPQATNIGVIR
ncbi:cold shock domain-containing protein [Streptomyces sp. NPDC059389]|uniref:cold-shock protein n=1 Tax=Streptomyces sp. NPDC059389 TaxID=3346818 RepID=UPI00369F6882